LDKRMGFLNLRTQPPILARQGRGVLVTVGRFGPRSNAALANLTSRNLVPNFAVDGTAPLG